MGYKKTDCPQGYKPNKYCPLDSSYFAECIPDCPSDYVTCEAPLKGVGEVCGNGLYQDCCTPICPAEYKYTLGSIPDGYEADGEPCRECLIAGKWAVWTAQPLVKAAIQPCVRNVNHART